MTDISQSNWSPNDASNNAVSPAGAPEGMLPSGVNNTMRAMMGATKRFWDRINGTTAVTNVGNAYTYTPTVAAPALADGEIYTFRCNTPNTGASTLNVGVGGAKALAKTDVTGTIPLVANDLNAGGYYMAAWASADNQFVVLNLPPTTIAPASVSANIFAALHSVSACLTSEIASLSVEIAADLRSLSLLIKADMNSVSAAQVVAWNANDDSTSAVIKADMNSVSAAHVAMLRSTSAVITAALGSGSVPAGSNMFFWNNAAPSGWTFATADDYTLITQAIVGNGGTAGGAWAISGISTESATHAHTFSASTGVPNATVAVGNGANGVATNVHTHTVSGTTGAESATHTHTGDGTWRPKHLKVIMCTKN